MQANIDKRLVWAVQLLLRVALLCVVFQGFTVAAQCTLSCPGGLNLSIAGPEFGCESEIAPIDIGVVSPSCTGLMDLDLYTSTNQILPGGHNASGARIGIISSTYIGMQLRARVTHRFTGNNCDVNLTIIDGLAPSLTLEDTTLSILHNILPTEAGGTFAGPLIEDCSSTTSAFIDSLGQVGCGDTAYAKTYRTWTVTDAFANTRTIKQEITQLAIQLDSIEAPRDTSVSCANAAPLDVLMGTPRVRFRGEIYSLPSLAGNQANLFWSYTDESFAGGGGTSQLLRSFRFFDACSPAVLGLNPRTLVQRISVVDTVAPAISTLLDTLYYSTSTADCEAVVSLPALAISDDCTTMPTTTVQLNGQFIPTNGGFYGALPLGIFNAVYTASDASNNSSSHTIVVIVRDQNPPVLITRNDLQLSLTTTGSAVVLASSMDQGSYDDCTAISWSIRKQDEVAWSNSLVFNCTDLDHENVVEIRGCDQFGNCNIRSAVVNVFDYIPPRISAPPDLILDCSISNDEMDMFGNVIITDNCSFNSSDSVVIQRDLCGVGEMRRYWMASDLAGNASSNSQLVTFVPNFTFSASDIAWPQDISLSMCASTDVEQMPVGFGAPYLSNIPCSDPAVSHQDQSFLGPSGVCEVIFRTWTVIDQCSYDGLSTGVWRHVQRIELVDLDAPQVVTTVDTIRIATTADSCSGGFLPATIFAIQDCSPTQSVLRLFKANRLLFEVPYVGTSQFIPKEANRIELTSVDACGNSSFLSIPVVVNDATPPVALCIDTLIYYLQEDSILLEGSLIDLGSHDVCGGSLEQITTDFVASCSSQGWNRVALTVEDSAGLQDVCYADVHVVDTMQRCKLQTTTVYGRMATNNNYEIPTRFDLVGQEGDTVATYLSEEDGSFAFDVALLDSVTVIPSSIHAPARFISTYDLYLIGQHILGLSEITDPLKRFSADGNRSRSISAFDLTLFRRLMLELIEALPHGNSFRFIPDTADLSLPDISLTPGIPMVSAASDSTRLAWHAVKLGDVSGTRTFGGQPIGSRTTAELSLRWFQREEGIWSLEYQGKPTISLYGLSLWLNHSSVRVSSEFSEGLLTAQTSKGTIVSWLMQSTPLSLKQGTRLLTVESTRRPELDLLKSDAVLSSELTSTPEEHLLSVTFSEQVEEQQQQQLLRVYPNPAKAGTMLRVSSEGPSISSLRLVDARGTVTELSLGGSFNVEGFLPRSLASGIYALQGRYKDGRTFEQRILVSN